MMDNFWDPFVSIPLIMGLMGVRIKHENFKNVVFAALAAVLTARFFSDDFDTITLSAGVFVSAIMMLIYRDKSIEARDKHLRNGDDNVVITTTQTS